ncbi:MAG: TrkH family potassium uptake protein [Gammaproteobacteria bacterium]|nr:TrkH family potassium uptake protein [Gammaproteobacteria bacterium]MCP5137669.1 TrkH family potassium uptake protein [Gammaproteobacteria bacterium]
MKFFRPILFVQAFVLMLSASLMLVSAGLASWHAEVELIDFMTAALVTFVAALPAFFYGFRGSFSLTTKQLFLVTPLSWVVMCIAGALPLHLALPDMSFTDAMFESVSGLTTTGSTVLTGLDHMSRSVLLWRALLQWVGGIGIVVLGIAILPFLQIGGMRLFRTESSDWSDKTMPRSHVLIRTIGVVYVGLTIAAFLAYLLTGMSAFDAVTHAMSSVSTGGYSNYDASMGHFNDTPSVLWVSSVFMVLSSLPFLLYTRAMRGDWGALLNDQQVRGFLKFLLLVIIVLSLERDIVEHESWFEAVTQSTFNIISVVTTTGYASEDYTLWSGFAATLFFYLTFVGGCSGSTTGAMKIFRFQIAMVVLRHQLRWMRHPHGVFATHYNRKVVPDEVVRSVVAFSFYFFATVAVIALGLSLLGYDLLTSLSGAATAVANVGPGLGDIIGPAGNFSTLNDPAKWLLIAGMLLGRLEILTVLIVFTPMFWQR